MATYDDLQTTQKRVLDIAGATLAGKHGDGTDIPALTIKRVLATALLPGRKDLLPGSSWFIGATDAVDGTALAVFSNGASEIPGTTLTSEMMGIRWNNHATPDPAGCSFIVPYDMDVTQASTLNILCYKVGATVGDAVTWLVTAFCVGAGSLSNADSDFGGTSSAMTGDATSLTMQLETLAFAADTMVVDGLCTITMQPTDGTLGTDDVVLAAVYLTYAKKLS